MEELRGRFKGTLLGALIGDCMGAYWERVSWIGIHNIEDVKEKIESQVHDASRESARRLRYTDDTALTFAMAESLVECKGFDHVAMAKKFTDTFFADVRRGYGGSVRTVFEKLKENGSGDVYGPASEQFNGKGSFGNGSCMRTSPGALYGHRDEETLINVCRDTARITHSHQSAINGALLQALAVKMALDSEIPLSPDGFLKDLLQKMEPFEKGDQVSSGGDSEETGSEATPTNKLLSCLRSALSRLIPTAAASDSELPTYQSQLKQIQNLLHNGATADEAQRTLGHGIMAVEAAPCALYAFLHCCDKSFKELIPYAISLGGDTDTIACMAGAIGGAYWGEKGIPKDWIESCESCEKAVELADKLFDIVYPEQCKSSEAQSPGSEVKSPGSEV